MTYPELETMQTLVVLIECRCMALMESGELHAIMDAASQQHVLIDDAHVNELQRREWLDIQEVGGELLVNVTPAGRYHGQKWDREQRKRELRRARA